MNKIKKFLRELKPYKRKYSIFWVSFWLVSLFIFQLMMYTIELFVPHVNSSFYYFFRGLYSLLIQSRLEPNSAQGFIFAGTVLGFIPIIFLIPILYFKVVNWFIIEKLSEKYISMPEKKYFRFAFIIHFSALSAIFLIIPGLLVFIISGITPMPHKIWAGFPELFSETVKGNITGALTLLYYSIGCLFFLIVFFWLSGLGIGWLYQKIDKYLEKRKEIRLQRKKDKAEEKRVRSGSK